MDLERFKTMNRKEKEQLARKGDMTLEELEEDIRDHEAMSAELIANLNRNVEADVPTP